MADREPDPKESASASTRTQKLFRAALFFAGSAVFGGLAVALWDRKALTAMRRRETEPVAPPPPGRDEDID